MPVPMWGNVFKGAALLAVLAWAGPATAADPQKIANDLVAAMSAGGEAQATYESATATGADVTITNLKVAVGGEVGSAEIGTLIIVNPVDRSPGGFTADSMSVGNGRLVAPDEGGTFTWATGEFAGITVLTPAEVGAQSQYVPFTSIALEGLTFLPEDGDAIQIARFDMSLGEMVDGTPLSAAMFVTGIELTPEALAAADLDEMMSDLNLSPPLVVSVGFDAAYERSADTLDIRTLSFEALNLGKIEIATTLSGVPLSALRDADGPDQLMATGKLNDLRVHFTNAGMVEKMLDMQARDTGLTRDALVQQLTGAMPFMLGFLGNPTFQTKLAGAATTFLASPQSFTITATPSVPVPIMELVQAANQAPAAVVGLLSLDVSAND